MSRTFEMSPFWAVVRPAADYRADPPIEDVAPWVRTLIALGWWADGETILLNTGFAAR
jgi:hypothetical protein